LSKATETERRIPRVTLRDGMDIKRSLTVPGRFEYLATIADFIALAGSDAGFDQDMIFHVQMAVDEACSNVIEHAYQGQDKGDITLSCHCDGKDWIIAIIDTGRPFDPDSIPAPNLDPCLDDIKTGGLGLYFMHQLMDEVEFSFDEEKGNRLCMVKRGV
jgi:serine/threonine-protein kinase RsbW